MNYTLNSNLTKNDYNNNNETNILFEFYLYLINNTYLLKLIVYILLVIFLLELLLISYLHIKKKTLKQLLYNNCFTKRLKRKKKIVIEMGHLSHKLKIEDK